MKGIKKAGVRVEGRNTLEQMSRKSVKESILYQICEIKSISFLLYVSVTLNIIILFYPNTRNL